MLFGIFDFLVAPYGPWGCYKKNRAEILYRIMVDMLDLEPYEAQKCQTAFQILTNSLWISGLLRPLAKMFAKTVLESYYCGLWYEILV